MTKEEPNKKQPQSQKQWDETSVVASGAAATATVSSFAETMLVLSGQVPDTTPLVTENSAPLVVPGVSTKATPTIGVNVGEVAL
eukprot:13120359-Ditylum_brightwellii.AAC.1